MSATPIVTMLSRAGMDIAFSFGRAFGRGGLLSILVDTAHMDRVVNPGAVGGRLLAGRYTLAEPLGDGATATIWRARAPRDTRRRDTEPPGHRARVRRDRRRPDDRHRHGPHPGRIARRADRSDGPAPRRA